IDRHQLTRLVRVGVIERAFPDTYRLVAVPTSSEQRLSLALLWAGRAAAGAARCAAEVYALEGVHAGKPEIVVPRSYRGRSNKVIVHRSDDRASLMLRSHRGFPVTGIEATLVALAHQLEGEAFEIACEDARRRGLTSIAALRTYLDRFGGPG